MASTDAFAACPSVFNFDFGGGQYTECFREVLRGSDILDGTDQGGTGHTAAQFHGLDRGRGQHLADRVRRDAHGCCPGPHLWGGDAVR